MPIQLDEPRAAGLPVVKRTALGQTFNGAVVRFIQRDVLKNGEPQLKDNGKARQELVVTLVTMAGTTTPAGIGGDIAVPAPGDLVRAIIRGQSFADWIQAKNDLGSSQVGDVLTMTTEYAQRYGADQRPVGNKITTQAELDAVPRGTSVGVYGPLTLRRATPAEAGIVAQAEAAYHASHKPVSLDGPDLDDI